MAIRQLRKNENIIIKSADKGGAVVLMDKELYIQEALRQLNNINYYQPLEEALYPNTAVTLTEQLRVMLRQGYITSKQFAYLKPNTLKMASRYFYLLPKIHKPRDQWPNPNMPAGRPIVSDCGSESANICSFIDYFLQPLSILHEAYT